MMHDIWFLNQVIEGDDNRGGGEQHKAVLYTVTKKGEIKRWEKGLDPGAHM